MKRPYKQPEPGDKIEVVLDKNRKEQGVLLESHDKGILLLKLGNGYNIGFKKEDISEIRLVRRLSDDNPEDKCENNASFKLSGKKPIIDFIITGGTISSKLDSKTGGVKSLIDSNEFFSTYPEIFEIADIRVKSPFMKLSENMDYRDWIRLAKIVGKSLNDKNVKGVIISHGTDTLHYTSAALSFFLGKLNKPVVLTYSQRSSDRGSADSRMNLKCSAYVTLSDISEVVIVGHASTNDDYCNVLRGVKTRKMHSSRRDAFKPINAREIARVYPDGKIKVIEEYNKPGKAKAKIDAVFDDKIALVKFYPGQNPEIIDYYRKKGYKGLVIEMTGLGHVCIEGKNNFLPYLKKAIEKGMLVFAVPQTLYGRLDPYVYSTGRKLEEIGVCYLEDILPETAYVKLGWVLGHKQWRGSAVTPIKMKENIHNEFNKRLSEEFLD